MSRIGRLPITIPSGVDVTIDGAHVTVKGPKGQLALDVAEPITVGDRELGALRINGRFRTNEPTAFLNAVEAYFPVEAHRTPGGETVLTGRP